MCFPRELLRPKFRGWATLVSGGAGRGEWGPWTRIEESIEVGAPTGWSSSDTDGSLGAASVFSDNTYCGPYAAIRTNPALAARLDIWVG